MIEQQKEVIVFGLDGNLFDNYGIKPQIAGEAMNQTMLNNYGIDKGTNYYSERYRGTSGMESPQQFEKAFKSVLEDQEIPDSIIEQTENIFRDKLEKCEKDFQFFPDAKAFLEFLRENHYRTVVTTSVPIEKVARIAQFTHLDEYITLICGRGGYLTSSQIHTLEGFKKGEDHYDLIQTLFAVDPKGIIAFSSTREDIKNAKDQGVKSIAISKIDDRDQLSQLDPDVIIDDYSEAPSLL